MCLATVVRANNSNNEGDNDTPLCTNVVQAEQQGSRWVFTNLLGRQLAVEGSICSIDLANSIILMSVSTQDSSLA